MDPAQHRCLHQVPEFLSDDEDDEEDRNGYVMEMEHIPPRLVSTETLLGLQEANAGTNRPRCTIQRQI